MADTTLYILFQRYINNQASKEEEDELLLLLADPGNEQEAKELLKETWYKFEPGRPMFNALQSKKILGSVLSAIEKEKERQKEITGGAVQNLPAKAFGRHYMLPAAAILFLLSFVTVFLVQKPYPGDKSRHIVKLKEKAPVNDLRPAGNKAVLTLADGRKIALDDVSNGKIANQAGISITKTVDGQLVYTAANPGRPAGKENEPPQINSITTPRGGKYQVNLPDGSMVWLNAASSLKFPTVFSGNERRVELTGEAYFEIAKYTVNDKKQPFKIVSHTRLGSQEVTVLGTHFNISAYENDNLTKTTLIEGSVEVVNLHTNTRKLLSPGQQAVANNGSFKIHQADMEEVMAWKNGNFLFNNLKLTGIMKQIERWYDVKVDYSNIPDTRYHGFISRNVTLSQVLEMLEMTGSLKFHIENIEGGTQKAIRIEK